MGCKITDLHEPTCKLAQRVPLEVKTVDKLINALPGIFSPFVSYTKILNFWSYFPPDRMIVDNGGSRGDYMLDS